MLILDKQKAVERIVALTDAHAPDAALAEALPAGARARRRVATFERRKSPEVATTRRRRAVQTPTAPETAPAF